MSAKINLVCSAPAERANNVVPLNKQRRPGRPRNSSDEPLVKFLRQLADPDYTLAYTARSILDYHKFVLGIRIGHSRAIDLGLDHMRKHYPGNLPEPKIVYRVIDGQRVQMIEPKGELKRQWCEPNKVRAQDILRRNLIVE
jgi:hypothetical protein